MRLMEGGVLELKFAFVSEIKRLNKTPRNAF